MTASPEILELPNGRRGDAPLLWQSGGRPVPVARFCGAVRHCAERLPQARYAINVCEDRQAFLTGFAAALLRGQTMLLPAARAAGQLERLQQAYPDSYLLDEALLPAHAADGAALRIQPGVAAAIAFTSGSTGEPQPHRKSLRALTAVGHYALQRFPGGGGYNIVATVPSQHMYVLETAVMLSLAGGCATHVERPFFPADVRRVLAEVPAPRLLVTTPVHLRNLVAAGTQLPEIALILSATAPLDMALAASVERSFGAPLWEIYGCTEAGSVATRRTLEGPEWRLYPGSRLQCEGEQAVLHASHLDGPVALPDVLEVLPDGRFRLLARSTDLVKVAGKRASLAELTRRLLEVPGVRDGVIFLPAPGAPGEPRPAALVVAPGVSEKQVLAALQRSVDPVFLPRPLRCVPALPRNELGKLPRAALLRLLET